MDGGSNVVCKISHAALTEDFNFEFDELPKKVGQIGYHPSNS